MPYRRLPNTDSARLRALKAALDMGVKLSPVDLCFSQHSLQRLKYFYRDFDQAIQQQKQSFKEQTEKSKEYHNSIKRAKLYISHFIQVLNFAIARGELSVKARPFFGIKENDKRVPVLNTEEDVIIWGRKIIAGEPDRIAQRGNPLTNPTVALVRVRYEQFITAHRYQKNLQEAHTRASKKIAELRPDADDIILNIWNEIEASFSDLNDDQKRERSQQYGLVYVYRKHEKEKLLQAQNIDNPVSPDDKEQQVSLAKSRQELLNPNKEETEEQKKSQYAFSFFMK